MKPHNFATAVVLIFLSSSPLLSQQTGNQSGEQSTGQSGSGQGEDLSLDRPELITDINELAEQQQSGFVGTNEQEDLFFGASQTGENASNSGNRNFNTRSQSQNINQGQTQPMYRTFGTNNVPYRSPHKIAFSIPASQGRVVDLKLGQHVRKLSARSPQFRNIVYEMPTARTVVLKGFVPGKGDKQLAELYIKMEPGVDRVINQLQVGQPTPVPPVPPLPSATQP